MSGQKIKNGLIMVGIYFPAKNRKQMEKIRIIAVPTETKTLISKGVIISSLFYCPKFKKYNEEGEIYQHLYGLSNDKLIDGDYFLWYSQNNDNYEVHKYHSDAGYGIKTYTNFNCEDESSLIVNHSGNFGKIVKTTDYLEIKTQIYHGFSSFIALDKVPAFSKKMVKKYIDHFNKKNE